MLRRASAAEVVTQAFSFHHRIPTREFLLAVVEPLAFRLVLDAPPVLQLTRGGTAQVGVKIIRRKGVLRVICQNPKHKQRQR